MGVGVFAQGRASHGTVNGEGWEVGVKTRKTSLNWPDFSNGKVAEFSEVFPSSRLSQSLEKLLNETNDVGLKVHIRAAREKLRHAHWAERFEIAEVALPNRGVPTPTMVVAFHGLFLRAYFGKAESSLQRVISITFIKIELMFKRITFISF